MGTFLGIDLVALIKTAGYLGLFFIVFAESGLLIGFFFPGDSLLFTAGFLASQGFLGIVPLILLMAVAAILGDNVGYAFGRRIGVKIFTREDSVIFHKAHLERARVFYEKYGGKTIVLARFMPVVRTFAPIVAGVGQMNYGQFVFYNFFGGLVWGLGMPLAGYFLGRTIPNVDHYLLPIILLIILISIAPPLWHALKDKEDRKRIKEAVISIVHSLLGRK